MTKRIFTLPILIVLTILLAPSLVAAGDSTGPLTGTWDCQAKGGPHGDTPFTLYLEQNGTALTGRVASSEGGAQITSGTFRDGALEIHIGTDDADYVLKADYDKGALTGTWSNGGDMHGTWEGKKQPPASK